MAASKWQKIWFHEIFEQFWAIVMAKLQSDRYEGSYFHKMWMEYYFLGKNYACLVSEFIPAAKNFTF